MGTAPLNHDTISGDPLTELSDSDLGILINKCFDSSTSNTVDLLSFSAWRLFFFSGSPFRGISVSVCRVCRVLKNNKTDIDLCILHKIVTRFEL